jgi:hypothetical protein
MEHHIVDDFANIKLMMSKFDLNFISVCGALDSDFNDLVFLPLLEQVN